MLVPLSLHAQRSSVAVFGGVATDQRGVTSDALTIAPSLVFEPSSRTAVHLNGSATRYTDAWSFSAGGAFNGRDEVGRFAALTLSASAGVTRLAAAQVASFAQGDLAPALELKLGRLGAFAGGRVSLGVTSQETTRPGFPFGTVQTTVRSNRAGGGPFLGVVVRATDAIRFGAREDRMWLGDTAVTDRTLSATLHRDRLALNASAGVRAIGSERASFAAASLSFAMFPGASLELSAGRYVANPLLRTPGGEYLSAGVAIPLGRSGPPRLPRPSSAPPVPRGATRLSIRAPDAVRVELAGDFNEWTPTPATRSANGVWYADVRLEPGQYRYAFRVNGTAWRVPDGATAVDDGFGGKSAWLTIPAR